MDFLNKANEDPSLGSAKAQASQGNKEFKAADDGVDVPQTLVTATKDAFYVSDSDEPFVPVSLAWEKGEGLPDEGRSNPVVCLFIVLVLVLSARHLQLGKFDE